MIYQRIEESGFVFSAKSQGEWLPFDEWKSTGDIIYYYPLSRLADNGFASVVGNECFVPFESIYLLDSDEQLALYVPKTYDKAIRLKADGILNQATFKYKVSFMSFPSGGDILPLKNRQGNVVTLGDDRYLLSNSQFLLLQAIDTFNGLQLSEKTVESNMRHYGHQTVGTKCQMLTRQLSGQ